MKINKKVIVRFALILVFFVGVFMLFSNQIQQFIVRKNSESFSISNYSREEIEKNQKEKNAVFDFTSVEPISTSAVFKAQLNKNKQSQPVVAGIAVPSVNINLPIFIGVANENLLWGAGTLSPTQQMGRGNYALASHLSYDPEALFSPLEYAQIGEKIYLNDLENVYQYEIYAKDWVEPDAMYVLDEVPGEAIVTLITCGDYDATSRLVIQGRLTDSQPLSQTEEAILATFE
ncbi:class A sortase [Enterococcus saccharolyticus]|uniref:class A sortase n=1 Tax=Enterococcus saccharolyticus TaxID=41997 RepID=UPI001E43084C|nr:class A sortase [Enterococcus saccharolyticus]MCD5003732.1 class A sortase [Enterococcus saccharolyticus]